MRKVFIFALFLLHCNLNAENITLNIAQITEFFDSHSKGKVNPVPFNPLEAVSPELKMRVTI